jgi:hypothetical protein
MSTFRGAHSEHSKSTLPENAPTKVWFLLLAAWYLAPRIDRQRRHPTCKVHEPPGHTARIALGF